MPAPIVRAARPKGQRAKIARGLVRPPAHSSSKERDKSNYAQSLKAEPKVSYCYDFHQESVSKEQNADEE